MGCGVSHSIFVTKKDFLETFHNRCAFSMKLALFAVNKIQLVTSARNLQDLVFHYIHVIQTFLLEYSDQQNP